MAEIVVPLTVTFLLLGVVAIGFKVLLTGGLLYLANRLL